MTVTVLDKCIRKRTYGLKRLDHFTIEIDSTGSIIPITPLVAVQFAQRYSQCRSLKEGFWIVYSRTVPYVVLERLVLQGPVLGTA